MATMKRTPGPASGVLAKALKALDKANVRVGWFDSSKYNDENQTPVAYVAAINEMGPNARQFMRPTADERDREWAAVMFGLSKQVIKGQLTVEQALEGVGLTVGADIQQKITSIYDPKLSLITLLARKARRDGEKVTGKTIGEFAARVKKDPSAVENEVAGISTKPLNDTGYMLATVSFSVNEQGSKLVKDE
jgi:hypothetical protein